MLTIAAGASTASFHYTDTAAARDAYRDRRCFCPGNAARDGCRGVPSQLAFVTAAQPLTAGTASQTMTVDLKMPSATPPAPAPH